MSARELITEHLDLWTGAVTKKSTSGRGSNGKIALTGIKKLRELILELAVQGRLGTQDANDAPVAVLFEKVQSEKQAQLKAKTIRKPKQLPEILETEHPFTIPESWQYRRLNEVGIWGSGATPKRGNLHFYGGGIPWFKSGELYKDFIDSSEETITDLAVAKTSVRMNRPGDVLIAMYGATIGKASILEVAGTTNQAVCACTPWQGISNRFLLLVLKAYRSRFIAMGAGGAQPNISREKIISTVIGLPPEREQHRIVQKVDELMAFCDRLEQQTSDQLEAHETLLDTLLSTLTQSENAIELADNWARLAAHFDTLFTTEQSTDKLKQTILQLAVMGRLVEQDAEDETARTLLINIADEKRRLVNEGKIKKPKLLASLGNELPYKVPAGWQWERLGNFTLVGTGATPSRDRPDYYSPPEHSWVASGETSQTYILDTKERVSSLAVKETNVTIYPAGTLVVAMYGQGKTRGQISELKVAAGTNQACAAIQPINDDVNHRRYIKLCFMKLYEEIREGAAGGAQPNLNTGKIANTLIPLPPLEEQRRIVQKVDELMALCARLRERLNQASETRCQLAETVVEGALN